MEDDETPVSVGEHEILLAEIRRLESKIDRRGPLRRLHRSIALGMDRIIPAGNKTKVFGAILTLISMGPSATLIPFPPAIRDLLQALYTDHPGKWAAVSMVVFYLLWAARDAVNYREEDRRGT